MNSRKELLVEVTSNDGSVRYMSFGELENGLPKPQPGLILGLPIDEALSPPTNTKNGATATISYARLITYLAIRDEAVAEGQPKERARAEAEAILVDPSEQIKFLEEKGVDTVGQLIDYINAPDSPGN